MARSAFLALCFLHGSGGLSSGCWMGRLTAGREPQEGLAAGGFSRPAPRKAKQRAAVEQKLGKAAFQQRSGWGGSRAEPGSKTGWRRKFYKESWVMEAGGGDRDWEANLVVGHQALWLTLLMRWEDRCSRSRGPRVSMAEAERQVRSQLGRQRCIASMYVLVALAVAGVCGAAVGSSWAWWRGGTVPALALVWFHQDFDATWGYPGEGPRDERGAEWYASVQADARRVVVAQLPIANVRLRGAGQGGYSAMRVGEASHPGPPGPTGRDWPGTGQGHTEAAAASGAQNASAPPAAAEAQTAPTAAAAAAAAAAATAAAPATATATAAARAAPRAVAGLGVSTWAASTQAPSKRPACCRVCCRPFLEGEARVRPASAVAQRYYHPRCVSGGLGPAQNVQGLAGLPGVQRGAVEAFCDREGATKAEFLEAKRRKIREEGGAQQPLGGQIPSGLICNLEEDWDDGRLRNMEWWDFIEYGAAMGEFVPTIGSVPCTIVMGVAEARQTVLEVARAVDTNEGARALKLLFFLDRLLLAQPSGLGNGSKAKPRSSMDAVIGARLRKFWRGEWQALWAEVLAEGQGRSREMSAESEKTRLEAQARRVEALLAEGEESKATGCVAKAGALASGGDVARRLQGLFPEARAPHPGLEAGEGHEGAELDELKAKLVQGIAAQLSKFPRLSSPGPSSSRFEHWATLRYLEGGPSLAGEVLSSLALGQGPEDAREAFLSGKLVALKKKMAVYDQWHVAVQHGG